MSYLLMACWIIPWMLLIGIGCKLALDRQWWLGSLYAVVAWAWLIMFMHVFELG